MQLSNMFVGERLVTVILKIVPDHDMIMCILVSKQLNIQPLEFRYPIYWYKAYQSMVHQIPYLGVHSKSCWNLNVFDSCS